MPHIIHSQSASNKRLAKCWSNVSPMPSIESPMCFTNCQIAWSSTIILLTWLAVQHFWTFLAHAATSGKDHDPCISACAMPETVFLYPSAVKSDIRLTFYVITVYIIKKASLTFSSLCPTHSTHNKSCQHPRYMLQLDVYLSQFWRHLFRERFSFVVDKI